MQAVKSEPFETFEIESWRDFDDFKMSSAQCVYRGQGLSQWLLKTGYERTQNVLNPMHEKTMLTKFISQAGIYTSNLPERNDFVSWFSLMQHYGAETRLLDVTRSKYIALFFAIMGLAKQDNETMCAVWAFDTCASDMKFYNEIFKSGSDGCIDTREYPLASALMECKEIGWRLANAFIVSDWEGVINASGFKDECKTKMQPFLVSGGVIRVIPQIQNQRMVAQAAEFLMPITLRRTFIENLLANIKDSSPKVVKLIIHKNMCDEFLVKLREMNITWQTIYPDITGLAMEVNW